MVAGGDLTGALEMLDQAEARYLPGFFLRCSRLLPRGRESGSVWATSPARGTWAAEHRKADAESDSYLDQYNALTEVRLLLAGTSCRGCGWRVRRSSDGPDRPGP